MVGGRPVRFVRNPLVVRRHVCPRTAAAAALPSVWERATARRAARPALSVHRWRVATRTLLPHDFIVAASATHSARHGPGGTCTTSVPDSPPTCRRGVQSTRTLAAAHQSSGRLRAMPVQMARSVCTRGPAAPCGRIRRFEVIGPTPRRPRLHGSCMATGAERSETLESDGPSRCTQPGLPI
jgi:hypothetical protein